jgi:2-polyprenyl-3-methyl-5-hydroxy-6-metoxy-1,4-benzoquinol methylase
MPTLDTRTLVPERMDDPALEPALHVDALRGLRRLNRLAGSARIVWPPIRALGRRRGRVRVLDLATGAGDVPLTLWRWARRESFRLELHGCDRSETALTFAREQSARTGASIHWFVLDALTDPLPDDFDVVMCSLFLHHLTDLDAIALLRKMHAAAGRMMLAHDLLRSSWGWLLAYVSAQMVSRSPIVHHDAPQSVSAAYTIEELGMFARLAELPSVAIRRHWPMRFLLKSPAP